MTRKCTNRLIFIICSRARVCARALLGKFRTRMDFALRRKFCGPVQTRQTVPCSARQEAGKKWACGGAGASHKLYGRKIVYTCIYCSNVVKLVKKSTVFVHADKEAICDTDDSTRRACLVEWMQPRISTLCAKFNNTCLMFPACSAEHMTLVVPEQCRPVDTDLVVFYNDLAVAGIFVNRQCAYQTLLPMYTLTVTDTIVASVNAEAVPQYRHWCMLDRWIIRTAMRSGRTFSVNNWSECINCMRWSCQTAEEQIHTGCRRGHSPFKCMLDCSFHIAFTFHTYTLIKCCNA